MPVGHGETSQIVRVWVADRQGCSVAVGHISGTTHVWVRSWVWQNWYGDVVEVRAETVGLGAAAWSRSSDFGFGFCFSIIYLMVLVFDCVSESEYEFVCCFLELQSELAGCYESEFELF